MTGAPAEDEDELFEGAAAALRAAISHFAHTPPASPLRRSPRRPSKTEETEAPVLSDEPLLRTSPRRKRAFPDSDAFKSEGSSERLAIASPGRSPSPSKKLKRGYAAPEVYAHLRALNDYLKEDLDVLFCGINPGCVSAETGHHFANPTNHFWRCLHQSGLTDRLLPPTEDFTLPDNYNLGLTNLVERPSAEAAELSPAEVAASVPAFLAKVARLRPRIVCFVGKGIWTVVEKAMPTTAPIPAPPASPKKGKGKKADASTYGLQKYQLFHGPEGGARTLFFMVPSTSGRVVSYQLPDKVKLFAELKSCLESGKAGKLDSSDFATVLLNPTSPE